MHLALGSGVITALGSGASDSVPATVIALSTGPCKENLEVALTGMDAC